MKTSAESRSIAQRLAFSSSVLFVLACGGEQPATAAAGSGGVSATGAAGVTAGAGTRRSSTETNALATAGKSGARSAPPGDAGSVAHATTPAAPDAAVDDHEDGGVHTSAGMGGAGTSAASAAGRTGTGGVGGSVAAAGQNAAGPTVTLTGQVIEAQANGNFTPYAGAKVCVLDSTPAVCAMSDASGMIAIKLPANARTGLTMEQDGLFPMFTPITTTTSDIDLGSRAGWSNYGAAVVISQETRSTSESMLGTKFDLSKGQADMIALSIGSGTVSIVNGSAELKWFRNAAGQTTVSDGPAPPLSALHGFTNIEPGMVTFRAENNGMPCSWDPMVWPGDQPGTVTVPIRAGWWTRLMEVRCN